MATTPEENLNPVTHKVEMLNNSPDGAMVFSPPFIHIKTGDSIEFVPDRYRNFIRNRIIENIDPVNYEDIQSIKGWDMSPHLVSEKTIRANDRLINYWQNLQ